MNLRLLILSEIYKHSHSNLEKFCRKRKKNPILVPYLKHSLFILLHDIRKISNYFSKSIHTSDIVAGNDGKIRGLSAFRIQGIEGQHGLSKQQQPED